jgi:hypothetical protein
MNAVMSWLNKMWQLFFSPASKTTKWVAEGKYYSETKQWYPNGQLSMQVLYIDDLPANGWSYSTWYNNGVLKNKKCYSNNLLIEEISYSKINTVTNHKIWNNRLKQLIDKPVPKPLPRPNVVTGYHHMGTFLAILPIIAKYIAADYEKEELINAYQAFLNSENDEGNWQLPGKEMTFGIFFEKGESLYYWQLRCTDTDGYNRAKTFMEGLKH